MITDPSYVCKGGRYSKGCRCDKCRSSEASRRRQARAKQRQRVRDGFTNFTHGLTGYDSWGCRCDVCVSAAKKNRAKFRAGLKSRDFDDVPHGTPNGYNIWGCRCEPCRAARRSDGQKYIWGAEAYARRERPRNEQSRTNAHHHRDVWTGPELEILDREHLSLQDASRMLGRTLAACREMRRTLHVDPRKQALAGTRRASREAGDLQ